RTAFHDRKIMVDATADAAAIVEDAPLLADDHIEACLERRDRRHRSGDATADYKEIRVNRLPVAIHQACSLGPQPERSDAWPTGAVGRACRCLAPLVESGDSSSSGLTPRHIVLR